MPSIILTFDNTQAIRIAAAFGQLLGLGRNATADEVKAYLVDQVKRVVVRQEQDAAMAALTPPTAVVVT